MKLTQIALLAMLLMPLTSFAASESRSYWANQLDQSREGDLAQVVREEFAQKYSVDCSDDQFATIQVLKLSSASMNESKTEGTPYEYQADYLVIQKCAYGSTFAGSFLDVKTAAILKASFKSNYNDKGGPLKMENLVIKKVKNVDLPKTQY